MKKIFILCAVIVFASCSNRDSDAISGSHSFELSGRKLEEMRRLADTGDSEAAFRLYQHYALGVSDQKSAEPWLRKAATLGHKQARQHLEVYEEMRKTRKDSGNGGTPGANPF